MGMMGVSKDEITSEKIGVRLGGKVQKEKTNSWIPISNNDRTIETTWKNFEDKFKSHAVYKSEGGVGSVIRFGSLFGGSSDGPPFLKEEDLALDEGMYKVCCVYWCVVL